MAKSLKDCFKRERKSKSGSVGINFSSVTPARPITSKEMEAAEAVFISKGYDQKFGV